MEVSEADLEGSQVEDEEWIAIKEESILFNEAFVATKYNELDEERDNDKEDDDLLTTYDKSTLREESKELENALKLIGLVQVEESNFKKNAIQQWSKELLEACFTPRDSLSSFQSLLRKRLEVQQRLHKAYLRDKERQRRTMSSNANNKEGSSTTGSPFGASSVPVVVRLGVLTLFPLLESLRSIKDVDHSKLCQQILTILLNILDSLPPLALHREPADCLRAFQDFIFSLITEQKFRIDSDEKSRTVLALIGLAISHGNAQDLLLVVDVLFNIHKSMNSDKFTLKAMPYLKQLVEYKKDMDLSILFEKALSASWTINQTSANNGLESFSQSEAMTCDGVYLYVHTFRKGLRKIGTGHGGTIAGHVYETNPIYRPSDKLKSLTSVNDKLFYLVPKTSVSASEQGLRQEGTSVELEEDEVEDEEEGVDMDDVDNDETSEHIQIAIIDSNTLKEEKLLTISPTNVVGRAYITSDGHSLYIISRRKEKRVDSPSDAQNSNEEFVVDVYGFSNGELTLSKSLKLGTVPPVNISSNVASPSKGEPPLPSSYWDKGAFYATGFQIVALLPADSTTQYTKARVFSLIDGKFISDNKIRAEPISLCTCYDSKRNLIWTYTDNQAESWKNLGLAPKHAFTSNQNTDKTYPLCTPEAILSGVNLSESLLPLQVVLITLAHMDRLARQHPIYGDCLVSQNKSSAAAKEEYTFCVDGEPRTFKVLHSIFLQVLACNLPEETKAYIILACMRILKVNIYELAALGKPESKEIRKLLCNFIDSPPLASYADFASKMIQSEACNVLAIGITIFYPSSSEQRYLFLSLLETAATLSIGNKLLLNTLLTQVSSLSSVSEVLLKDSPVRGNEDKMELDQVGEQMEVEAKEQKTSKDVSRRLLYSLVDYVFDEGIAAIDQYPAVAHCAPLVSPGLRLLLALQRDLISNPQYSEFLYDYTCTVLSKCKQMADHVVEMHGKSLPNDSLDNALKSSMIGIILQPLLVSLCRKKISTNITLVTGLLPHFLRILKSIDNLCKLIPKIHEADRLYTKQLTGKKEKKYFVESKHPYPQGKNQLKQTVVIPGAEALCLHFDPRSRTHHNSSDVLQLYRSASMSDPIPNKDGKATVFSGTNFPKQSVVIQGDAVTFAFSANSRYDPKAAENNKYRWGFKCKITALTPTDKYEPVVQHWLLDIENLATLLGAKFSGTLIEGEPLSEKERKSESLLEANILSGGLEDNEVSSSGENKQFIQDFIEGRMIPMFANLILGKGETSLLYNWMEKQSSRRMLSQYAKKPLEIAERYIIAAMMKQLSLVDDAKEFVQILKTENESSMDAQTFDRESLRLILQETGKVITSIQQKGQAENVWRVSVKEKQPFDSFHAQWREEKKERLMEMCEIKGVEFDARDEKNTIERLFQRLQEDIKALEKGEKAAESNPYETMSLPIIERAKLLLRMRPAKQLVELPSAESPNPFAVHRNKVPVDFEANNGVPISRSSSYHPHTDVHISKEFKKARTEQHNKAFNRRVKELRKWLQAWKRWHGKTASTTNPLHAVSSFMQSTLSTQELEGLLQVQVTRAKHRIEGLKYYHQLFELVSFNSSKQQILACCSNPFSNGGHYLDNISTCGPDLSARVTEAFVLVFDQVVKILRDKSSDSALRLLGLLICSLSYKEFDVELLRVAKVFPLLQQIVGECTQRLQQSSTRHKSANINKVTLQETPQEPQQTKPREIKPKEEKDELERLRNLRKSSWTAFRLLAARCLNWDYEEQGTESESLLELQDQVFELMCSELKTMSQQFTVHLEDDSTHCFELLSLLCLLGASPKGYKSLSREENLTNLVSILKANSVEPRAKRLALRLCRRLLPSHTKENIPKLVDFFMDEIGSRVAFEERKKEVTVPPHEEVEEQDQPMLDDMAEQGSDEEIEEEAEEDQYSVYLNNWTLGHLRLIEVCQNALGQDFFTSSTGSVLDRPAIEARAQQIIQETNDEGQTLLKTTTLANCNLLASSLASVGGSVSVLLQEKPKPNSNMDEDKTNVNRNLRKVQRKSNPTTWISGSVAQSLASEYVCLTRQLLDPTLSSKDWSEALKSALGRALIDLPSLLSGQQSTEKVQRVLAALSILGGFIEVLRIGGKVSFSEFEGETKTGVVVDIDMANSIVEVQPDMLGSLARVPISRKLAMTQNTPIPEIEFDSKLFPLNVELLSSLVACLLKDNQVSSQLPGWLYTELKSKTLRALSKLLQYQPSAQLILQPPLSQQLPALLKAAASSQPSARTLTLEKENSTLIEKIWDLSSKPEIDAEDMKVKRMVDTLPHFTYSRLADILPTCWTSDKTQGMIFKQDKRKIEFVGIESNPLTSGRRSYISRAPAAPTEVVITANSPVPTIIPEYYFEVTIDQMESNGSLISVGLAPEGTRTWSNNSYRYQANAKKTTFASGSRRQNDYGIPFRAKSVVGCGWNRDEKVIYFTKDGVDQGVAFTNVILGKVVPAVGVSKGVHVTVNFGQEPFRFKLAPEGETEEERERRKKEDEEKRKKAKEEDEARRKKEKEDEHAANVLAAQPILVMGFDLKKALVALRQTGYSGPEAAINWLIENEGSWNWAAEAEKEEEAKEEEKEAEIKEEEKPKEKPKEKDQMESVTEKPNFEEQYNTGISKSYHLGDSFNFTDEDLKKEQQNKAASEWEDNVIPAIKAFMEKDGFSPFEVEEYLQQIRTQVTAGNDQQARGIVMQILGDAGCNIQFPAISSSSASKVERPPLRIEDAKAGCLVTVSRAIPQDVKHWVPAMDKTTGLTGIVKTVDHQAALVLVQFYNPETAALNEWWYPIRVLEKPEKPAISGIVVDSLKTKITDIQKELANIYARKSVLALLSTTVTLVDGPVTVQDMLHLVGLEGVSSELLSFIDSNPSTQQIAKQRLLSIYETKSNAEELTKILVKQATCLLDASASSDAKHSTFITSTKPPAATAQAVKVDTARSAIVLFDRSCFLPANSQASLEFYYDEACIYSIKCFTEKSKFLPLIVNSNQFWIKLSCSPAQRANAKYKLEVVPISPQLSLAFWIIDFVLEHSIKQVQDVASICASLFSATLDYIYCTKPPSAVKESAFYLLGRIIAVSTSVPGTKRLPFESLTKLREEMVALYDVESKREGSIFSTYLQSLIELMMIVREAPGSESFFGENEPVAMGILSFNSIFSITLTSIDLDTTPTTEKSEKAENAKQPSVKKDEETLQIAIALANSFKSAEQSESEETKDEKKAESQDDELATALALSMTTPSSVTGSKSNEEEEEKQEEEPEEEETSNEDLSLYEDDMDEDMKAAIQLSMQSSTGEPETKPTQPESVPQQVVKPPEVATSPSPIQPMPANLPPPAPSPAFTFASPAALQQSKDRLRSSKKLEPSTPLTNAPPTTSNVQKPVPLPWLTNLLKMKRLAEALLLGEHTDEFFKDSVKRAWEATKKDCIRDRLLLVDNLPLIDADKREELEGILKRAFSEAAQISSLFMPVDEATKQTKGYAFVEITSTQKVDATIKKMHRHKLKAPTFVEESPANLKASLRASASLPRGTLKILRFTDLEKSEDARVIEFLQSKLISGGGFAPKCKAALVEIFNSFGGEKEAALVAAQLNELQVASNGKPLTTEQLEFAFSSYETKQIGQEPALTLNGFLELYLRQCIEAPLDTWEELTKLGYDLNLNRNSFINVAHAIRSQEKWTHKTDAQLVNFIELIYTECEVSSPLALTLDHIRPFEPNDIAYPLLAKVPLPALRLRFQLLKNFNSILTTAFPLVNFSRRHTGSLSYLLSSCRSIIFHTTKMDFIYDVLDKTSVQGNQPTVSIDRLKLAAKKDKEESESILINHTMFGIAFSQFKNVNPMYLRQKKPGGTEPHFSMKIVFKGENVQGEGGPYRQFFTDVSKELQGVLPLFLPCPNAQQGEGENRDKWIINPSCTSPNYIAMYEFIGRLMGMAMRTGVLLTMDLPSLFWKFLVGISPDIEDLKQIDKSVYRTLKFFSRCTKEELEQGYLDETFTTWLSDRTEVPLIEGGETIKVTFENRLDYVKLVEKTRLNESFLQMEAIKRGLSDVIPTKLLQVCTWQDLEWKICGKPFIDIHLLKRHTMCSGVSSDATHVGYFWATLHEFNQQDRRGFLRFVWAQERLPVNDEEFERSKTRMMIKPFLGLTDPNAAFPKADTCFFNIMLPEYSSQKLLRERLLFAIHTDSHSMNADEPTEDELTTVDGRRPPSNSFSAEYSSDEDSD